MAHLPPRVPNMSTPNWPADFSSLHQKMEPENPLWADAFLDLSSKRGSHRRSMSDSIAFLDTPMVEECRRLSTTNQEFERFDDEQIIMSMFNDQNMHESCSNPSSPSEYINDNEDKSMNKSGNYQQMQLLKNERGEEVESSCKFEEVQAAAGHNATADYSCDNKVVDPKRIKRILANRQSAQRSRVRKLQYVSELERSVSTLQAEISVLSPRVAFLDHQRLVLNVDNSALRQRIAALAQDKLFKDAHQEALKQEIERLRQLYYQQDLKKMGKGTTATQSKSQLPAVSDSEMKVQLVN